MDPSDGVAAALDALGRGDVEVATALARQAVDGRAGPPARELLAGLLLFDDDVAAARRQLELAFREWRLAGNERAAALVAATLADVHTSWLGNRRAGQGWAARGRRLLEGHGRCVEAGYVALAVIACEVEEIGAVEAAAAAALELAVEFADSDLEVRALADSGYALVVQGHTAEGFARLDEAMAALSAGEVGNPAVAAMSFCALLAACERLGDARRAEEWTRVITAGVTAPLGNRPRALHTHCRLVLGSVLCTTGHTDEGEAALLEALGPDGSAMYAHRSEAAVRLASLRLLQGRLDEARALVLACEERLGACEVLARIHLAAGELALAASVARRALTGAGGDVLRAAAMCGVLVEVALAEDDVDGAASYAGRLRGLAEGSDSDLLRAEAALADGRVAAARVDVEEAVELLRGGLGLLGADDRPLLRAILGVELAEVLVRAQRDREALDLAHEAVATLDRLGAVAPADRARSLLRSLGVAVARSRPSVARLGSLTDREQQVLALLGEGLTNAEIGERLFISAKTAEHHVSRVLGKLGARSRAEAASIAAVGRRGE